MADDTKVYNSAFNKDVLQQDLNYLQKWTEKWCLYFNVLKCKDLHIGSNNENHEYVPCSENDNNTSIMKCTEEKDLGVIFDKDLVFGTHVQSAINKAYSMLGIIRRTFSFLNKDILLQLYKTLVLPHLEYGNVIWHLIFKRQSVAIEKVQCQATKLLKETKNLSYDARRKMFDLPTPKYRRFRGDMIQTYKIINKVDNINFDTFFFFCKPKSDKTRDSEVNLFNTHCNINKRKNAFSNRSAQDWHTLNTNTKKLQA